MRVPRAVHAPGRPPRLPAREVEDVQIDAPAGRDRVEQRRPVRRRQVGHHGEPGGHRASVAREPLRPRRVPSRAVDARTPAPRGDGGAAPEVSVVVPAYREAARLPRSLERLPRELEAAGVLSFEVIVVDDGSDDATPDVVRAAAARDPRVRLLRHEENRGKGRAVRAGVLASRGAFVLVTDADLSTPPADAALLLDVARRGTPVVVGSRRLRGARILVRQPLHREAIGFAFAALRRLLVLPSVRDTQCGFKVFEARAAKDIFSRSVEDGFVYDVEILALARDRGYAIAEVAVRWADDPRTQVRAVPASLSMLLGLLRLSARRFTPRAGPRGSGRRTRGRDASRPPPAPPRPPAP